MAQKVTEQKGHGRENQQNDFGLNGADTAAEIEKATAPGAAGEAEKPSFYGSPQSLRLIDLLDFAFKVGNHVDRLWNMFLVASVGVLTLIVSTSTRVSEEPSYRAAVFVIYALFCVINACNLFRMYQWLDAAVADLKDKTAEFGGTGKLKAKLERASIPGGKRSMLALYVLTTLLVLAGIVGLPLIRTLWRWP
ncbi:MAG: hypothetical protein JOZ96_02470 [Acidobacteria bacterium]|nr:hypothetical protein [Acidobacteriota bacterium]